MRSAKSGPVVSPTSPSHGDIHVVCVIVREGSRAAAGQADGPAEVT